MWVVLMISHAMSLSFNHQKDYPVLGSDTSSVWNFCAHSSNIILWEKPVVASQNVGCFLRLLKLVLSLYLVIPRDTCLSVWARRNGGPENVAWFLNQVLKSREHCCASYGSVCLTGGWTTANTGGNGTVIRTSCMLKWTETLHFHTVEALLSRRKSFCPMR